MNSRTTERPNDRTTNGTAERQNGLTTKQPNNRTAERWRQQAPPHMRGVGTRQPSVGPLFTRNAMPSLSCRMVTLVTNFVFSQCNIHTSHCFYHYTFMHSIIVLLLIITHFKDKLTLCLLDLLDDGEEEHDSSCNWIDIIDRGGLTHVNNVTYNAFLSMEGGAGAA